MAGAILECPSCHAPLPDGLDVAPTIERCGACNTRLRVATFPAFFQPPPEAQPGQSAIEDGEATCFHHDQKRAVATCDACGKFLCQLCDVELPTGHFCTQCFEQGARKGKIAEVERSRPRYDTVVLMLALLGLFLWTIPLVPLGAFIFGIVKRKAPPSLVHRSRVRLYLGLTLAVIEFIGGCAFWIAIWASNK